MNAILRIHASVRTIGILVLPVVLSPQWSCGEPATGSVVALSDDFSAPDPLAAYTVASPRSAGQAAMDVLVADGRLVFRWVGNFGTAAATHPNTYPLAGSRLEADVTFVTAANPRCAAGVEWFASADDAIQLALQQDEDKLYLFTTIDGVFSFETAPFTVEPNTTYRLSLDLADSGQILCSVDGEVLIDQTPDLSGVPSAYRPALVGNSHATVDLAFDDFLVSRPSYASAGSQPAGVNPYHLAVADFNGDEIPDVAVANPGIWPDGNGTLSVLLGNGDGSLQPGDSYPLGVIPQSVTACDLNNDGWPDLVAANRQPGGPAGDISAYLNVADGSGDFTLASTTPSGDQPINLTSGHFNNDGFADVAVAVHGDDVVQILLGDGDGTFTENLPAVTVGDRPNGITVCQLDPGTDNHEDIVTADWGSGGASVLLGDGSGNFTNSGAYGINHSTWSIAAADMNKDGHLDLVAPSTGSALAILLGNGDGTFQPKSVTSIDFSPYLFEVADVDLDGNLDFVGVNGGAIRILPGNGDGSVRTPGLTVEVPTGPFTTTPDVAVADMNRDGTPDLVVTQQAPSNGIGAVLVLLQQPVEPPLSLTQSTIDPASSFAYAANAGWIDLRPSLAEGVVISETFLAGSAYAANFGWVRFGTGSPANGHSYANNSAGDCGVNLLPDGGLSGRAYAGNIGWITFEQTYGQPRLDHLTGAFSGYAYSGNIGWIALDTAFSDLATTTIAYPDSDLDGIADSYERRHFGDLATANATSDNDGDGRSDRDESATNSDATDPFDFFRILSITHTPGDPAETTLTFTSAPARVVRIEWDENLQPPWSDSPLGTFLCDPGPTTTRTFEHPDAARGFFRAGASRPLEP